MSAASFEVPAAEPLPDVVPEVDRTTDVRRRKLGNCKEAALACTSLAEFRRRIREEQGVRHGPDARHGGGSRP